MLYVTKATLLPPRIKSMYIVTFNPKRLNFFTYTTCNRNTEISTLILTGSRTRQKTSKTFLSTILPKNDV
jgi:hypothetical protein